MEKNESTEIEHKNVCLLRHLFFRKIKRVIFNHANGSVVKIRPNTSKKIIIKKYFLESKYSAGNLPLCAIFKIPDSKELSFLEILFTVTLLLDFILSASSFFPSLSFSADSQFPDVASSGLPDYQFLKLSRQLLIVLYSPLQFTDASTSCMTS